MPDAKQVLDENRERIKHQKSVRTFSTLEKTLESNPERSLRRQAEREQASVVKEISRDNPVGVLPERLRSAAKRGERAQARERGQSRGE